MLACRPLFRLTASTALASLMLATLAPAYAQAPPTNDAGLPALPQASAQDAVGQVANDPPARVGSVSSLGGTVSFHTGDADHWERASLNYPVTAGNSFWTQPAATADLDFGGTRVTLDQSTEFSVDTLDDQNLNATLAQGRIFVLVRPLASSQAIAIRTPRGTVTLSTAGRYEITVGDTQTPTLVTVDDGQAGVNAPNVQLALASRQTGQISGIDPFDGILVSEVPDPFLERQLARLQTQRIAVPQALPPAVAEMTGYEAVASTGQWQQTADYGQVWYPPVASDWVPYRQGHWSYVAPWGWTWVDDASWGFAPFHYGRWVQIGPRWCWTPVSPGFEGRERPIYAPALVTFLGVGVGVAVGVGIGAAVGWIPLGPREVYRPPYRVSNNYLRQVNVTNISNVTNITNVTNINTVNNRYVNNNARTVVPAVAMQRSLPVATQVRSAPQLQRAVLQPQQRPAVLPTLATRGVTPSVVKALSLQPVANTPAARAPVGPGPNIQPHPPAVVVPPRPPIPNRPGVVPPRPPVAGGAAVPGVTPVAPGLAKPALPPAHPPVPGAGVVPGTPVGAGAAKPPVTPVHPPVPGAPAIPGVPPIAQPGLPGVRPIPQAVQHPAAVPVAPQVAHPAAVPQVQHPVPVPQIQRVAPPPQIQRPLAAPQVQHPVAPPPPHPIAPQVQRVAPPPQVQRAAPPPQVQRAAPPPQIQRPTPPPQVQRAAPPPQVQRVAPPPQIQRPTPPPQIQRPAPPPQIQRPTPPPQIQRPAPPPPIQHPAPPPAHACPPGKTAC